MTAGQVSISADPCPFCACADVWIWDKGVPGRFAVACSNAMCAATGPMATTEAQAVLFWNGALRRHATRANAGYQRVLDEAHRKDPGERG